MGQTIKTNQEPTWMDVRITTDEQTKYVCGHWCFTWALLLQVGCAASTERFFPKTFHISRERAARWVCPPAVPGIKEEPLEAEGCLSYCQCLWVHTPDPSDSSMMKTTLLSNSNPGQPNNPGFKIQFASRIKQNNSDNINFKITIIDTDFIYTKHACIYM